jgi:transcriptional regulator with XRE-family HTH domain
VLARKTAPVVRLEQVIGANIRRIREGLRQDQTAFAARLGDAVEGKKWTRQNISAMETGARAFAARDLVAIAHYLEVPVGALLHIPEDVGGVQLRPGKVLNRADLVASGWQSNETSDSLVSLSAALDAISDRLDRLMDDAHELRTDALALNSATIRLRHLQALEAEGAAIEEDYQ